MSGWERHLARMVNGTVQIGPRRWRWLWESKDGRTIIARLAATVAWGWALYRLGGQWHWLWGAAIVAVLFQAYRGAEDEPEEVEQPEGDDLEPEPELPPAPPAPTEASRQLIVDSVLHLAAGYANVHLCDLADHMEAEQWCVDLSEFRRWVEAHDVPTRDSVKSRGITRSGIRVADLPQPPPDEVAETPPPPLPVLPPDALQDW